MNLEQQAKRWERFIARNGPVSIALLHRLLGCGYSEAARLLERLRARGLA